MFNWFRKNPKDWLHGVDLRKYHYLGLSRMSYTKEKLNAEVYFFVNKNDSTDRVWVIPKFYRSLFKYHHFVEKWCPLWRIGELRHFDIVTYPSKYLITYVLEMHNHAWNPKTESWVKQEPQPPNDGTSGVKEGNVIAVDFSVK